MTGVKPSAAARSFLAASFWAVGVFCVYWETLVFAAVHRFRDVELPIIGECTQVEAVTLTLSFFWGPLLLLHLILHAFQRMAANAHSERPRFPGAVGDEEVPTELKFVRVSLFIILVLWPTGVHVFLTGRAFDHFHIVPSGFADQPTKEWKSISGKSLLFFPIVRPEGSALHDTFWWVNGARAELREEWADNAQDKIEDAIGKREREAPPKVLRRVKVTAVFGQPFVYALLSGLAVWSSVVAFVNGFHRRGITFIFRSRKPPLTLPQELSQVDA